MLLHGLLDQDARRAVDTSAHSSALQIEVDAVRLRLERLDRTIKDDIVKPDDILRQRIFQLRGEDEKARAALDRARPPAAPRTIVGADPIARFGRVMRERMNSAHNRSRGTYIASVVSAIEVHDDLIWIVAQTEVLKRTVAGQTGFGEVRSSVRKWRTRHDSNV